MPNILHQVSVPVIDNLSCQEMFNSSGHKKTIRDSFLCAGYKDGKKDSCEVINVGKKTNKNVMYDLAVSV